MKENPNAFWQRAIGILVILVVLIVGGRMIFLPDSWGELGYYRADAVIDELNEPVRHGQNKSCKECHKYVYKAKEHSVHERLACESCHAPLDSHVKSGKKVADMPVAGEEELTRQCLGCHKDVTGRKEFFPVIVDKKTHLQEQGKDLDNECSQCHNVHAPKEHIDRAKQFKTLAKEVSSWEK